MNNDGYKVVDNFLDPNLADELYTIFSKSEDWKKIVQERENHYNHVFLNDDITAPDQSEIYSAKFWRSNGIESNDRFLSVYQNSIIEKLTKETNLSFLTSDIRCYKLIPGDYYRSHCDDYAGDIGLILYLNKKWKYDWGGLLNILDNGEVNTIVPKFNRAVIIWHEKFKLHHCVSSVAEFAREPRFTITSFNRVKE